MVDEPDVRARAGGRVGVDLLVSALDGAERIGNAPGTESRRRASVAAIFSSVETDTRLLFIQRATVEGDPWSGQMAFPGGRVEPNDTDSFATAERETREEIGVDLSGARRLGSLADVDGGRGTNRSVVVSGHGYWLDEPPAVVSPNHEVADVLWVPMTDLLDPNRYIDYHYPLSQGVFPGIQLDDPNQVIWGLTLRFLADLMARLKHPFII